jgi:hypothetical protein
VRIHELPVGSALSVLSRRIVYSILLHSTATLPAMCIGEGEKLFVEAGCCE